MQKLKPQTAGLKPTKIGHMDSVSVDFTGARYRGEVKQILQDCLGQVTLKSKLDQKMDSE